jgi:hypothetical protein
MSDQKKHDYLYVVDWDDSVHRPPYTVVHGVTLRPGVEGADLEKHVREGAFAQVGNLRTRAGQVARQALLVHAARTPGRLEELDFDLESFGTSTVLGGYRVVASWERAQGED